MALLYGGRDERSKIAAEKLCDADICGKIAKKKSSPDVLLTCKVFYS